MNIRQRWGKDREQLHHSKSTVKELELRLEAQREREVHSEDFSEIVKSALVEMRDAWLESEEQTREQAIRLN